MSEQDAGPAVEGTQDDRIAALETGQQQLGSKLDQLLQLAGGGQAQGEGQAAQGPAGPGDISAQIQSELDRRDAATREEQQRAETGNRLARLEHMTQDRPPRAPLRRITRIMYGPQDSR